MEFSLNTRHNKIISQNMLRLECILDMYKNHRCHISTINHLFCHCTHTTGVYAFEIQFHHHHHYCHFHLFSFIYLTFFFRLLKGQLPRWSWFDHIFTFMLLIPCFSFFSFFFNFSATDVVKISVCIM